jgi:NAD(P)-dependent dehydrogenase (short-subunit alcohol dehydrogenase family)
VPDAQAAKPVGDGRQELADWFHVPHWESLPPAVARAGDGARWLLFADTEGVADALSRALAERGDEVIVVRRGDGFAACPDGTYRVNPEDAADYATLLSRLRDRPPTKIVHLWLVAERPADPLDEHAVATATRDGFTSLLALAKALGAQTLTEPVTVAVVSSEMHAIAGTDAAQPGKALALGPVGVLPLEDPRVTCRAIDLARPAEAAGAVSRLLAELDREVDGPTGFDVVALRGRLHLRRTFRQAPLPPDGVPRLRPGGTYLITGGLGGIGLSVAAYLAENFQANLVLVGRTALPPRAEWDSCTGETAERVRAVRRLEEHGANVLVAAADVTDAGQVTGVVRQAVERFGGLNGVVHAAGVPGGGLIQLKDAATAAEVLAPKVTGTLALRRACLGLPLDFVVLCSSGIAVTGGTGQVDYAAANSFLDAVGHHEPGVVSVNWDAWRDIGMAAKTIDPGGRTVAHPFLERRLTAGRTSVYVAHFDATRSWLVDEHRMLGRPVVPGVGHFELVRAAYCDDRERGDAGVELTDVTFYTPIVVPGDGRREVRVVLEHEADGTTFAVVSAHGDRWQLHSTGRVGELTADRPGPVDVGRVSAGLRDAGKPAGTGPMGFGARSQCLSRMWAGDGRFLARLDLAEPYRDEVAGLPLHPALLDIASAFVGVHHAAEFRIPLSYGALRVFAPLEASVLSYQEYRDGDRAGKETVTSDFTITDLAGNVLVRAENFVLKRVHDLDERLRAAHDAAPDKVRFHERPMPHDAESAGFLQSALESGMTAAEGTEVFARVLASGAGGQVLVSTRPLDTVTEQIARARAVPAAAGAPAASAELHPRPALLTPYEAPRDGLEESLVPIWQDLLGVDKIGVHDNFFELGGHSLLGLQLVPKLRDGFGVDLPIGTIFDALTVAGLADALRAGGAGEPQPQLMESHV